MSHYFPMVSSSPPPFEDNHNYEDEIDDEFGDFSSAGDILHDDPTYTTNNFSTQQAQCKQIDGDENVVNKIKIQIADSAPITPVVANGENGSIIDDCDSQTDQIHFSNLSNKLDQDVNGESNLVIENVSEIDVKEDVTAVNQPPDSSVDFVLEKSEETFRWGDFDDEDLCDDGETFENLNGVNDECTISEAENLSVQPEEIVELKVENVDSATALEFNENDKIPSSFSEDQQRVLEEEEDFADFQNVVETSQEDFDDFQTFESEPKFDDDNGQLFEVNFDAFNDENSIAFPPSETDDLSEDDEFGNFESTPQVSNFEHLISSTLSVAFENVDINCSNSGVSSEILRFDDLLLMKTPSTSSDCVWEKLNDIDNTHALTYHWSTCRSNKLLLHSLHLNSQNFDTIVPPAQFDWGSSGLINPLDGLETEFLGVDSDRGSTLKPISPLVNKILSEANKTKTRTTSTIKSHRRNTMSEEAKRILNSLQDLSFMQAKMLMFPIRDGCDFET
ncbi:hypothetical protein CHUAL_004040 [Chamberlinius hualienensis]